MYIAGRSLYRISILQHKTLSKLMYRYGIIHTYFDTIIAQYDIYSEVIESSSEMHKYTVMLL